MTHKDPMSYKGCTITQGILQLYKVVYDSKSLLQLHKGSTTAQGPHKYTRGLRPHKDPVIV